MSITTTISISRRGCTITGFILLALLVGVPSASAQPLAQHVPDDAIFYVGWSGSTALPAGYQQSHLKALLDESNIPELFSQFMPALQQRIAREEPDARKPMEIFTALARPMWKYPTAIYFSGMNFDHDAGPMPRIAYLCQAGPEAEALQALLERLLADAPDDVPFTAFRSGDVVGLYAGYANEKQAMAGAGAGGAAKPIAADANFKNALARLEQPEPVLILYVDIERALALVDQAVEQSNDPQAQQIWPKVRDASGLRGLKRAIFTDGFDGKDWGTRGFIEAPAPRAGLLAALDAGPLSDDLLKTVPQSATIVMAGKFDPGAFLHRLREIVGAVDPQAQRMFDQGLGISQMMIGRNLQTDILDPLGDEWAMYLAPDVGGGGLTGVVMVNKLDDPKKAEQGLVSLSLFVNNMIASRVRGQEMAPSFKNTMIDDMRVWYFAVPFVAPAWGIKDGNLYVGLYPQSVAAAARFTASGKKTFLENEKYTALKQRLGVQSPHGIRFVDLPQVAGTGYQMLLLYVRMGLGFADMWGVETPEPVLPGFDKVLARLSPAGSMSWVDDAGWHMRGVAPFPASGLLSGEQALVSTGAAAMMTGIMLPSLHRARETANRVKCASNLRQLGQGMLVYANENRGRYPDDYATLVKYMLDDMGVQPDVLICPSGHGRLPPRPLQTMQPHEIAAWAEQNSPYVYLGGGKTVNLDHRDVIIYERLGNHSGDGVNMLFGDGHVEFQPTQRAAQTLSGQGVEVERERR